MSIKPKSRTSQFHIVHNLLECFILLRNMTNELLLGQPKRQTTNYLFLGMLQQLADFMATYPIDGLHLNHPHHH